MPRLKRFSPGRFTPGRFTLGVRKVAALAPSLRPLHLLLLLGIAGCALVGVKPAMVDRPVITAVSGADVPVFDRAVIGAVEMRLRGVAAETVARDLLVDGSGKIEPGAAFRFDGFLLRKVVLIEQASLPDGVRLVRALLNFNDLAGRSAAVETLLSYRQSPGGVELVTAAWAPVYRSQPRTTMYLVTAERLLAESATATKDYGSLYRFARLNGVAMDASGAAPGAAPGGEDDYVILVFVQDWLAPGAGFEVRLADNRATGQGVAQFTRYASYDGWAVGLIPGRFALDRGKPFWVKAVFRPAPDSAGHVVGLFSSQPVQ